MSESKHTPGPWEMADTTSAPVRSMIPISVSSQPNYGTMSEWCIRK